MGFCVLRSILDNSNALRNMASVNERTQNSGRSQLEWAMLLRAMLLRETRLFSGFWWHIGLQEEVPALESN